MKIKTKLKAGGDGLASNHNQTGIRVRTNVKAGAVAPEI